MGYSTYEDLLCFIRNFPERPRIFDHIMQPHNCSKGKQNFRVRVDGIAWCRDESTIVAKRTIKYFNEGGSKRDTCSGYRNSD